MLKESFAKKIKEIRKSRKLTQEQLAEAVGVDFRYISLIENAKNFPSCDLLERLTKALDVSYKEIFDFDDCLSRCEIETQIINNIKLLDDKHIKMIYNFIKQII